MNYELTFKQMSKMLKNLSTILDKANAHADAKKFDVQNLLTTRLAPDQLNFTRQIQIATDAVKGVAARLAGQEPPVFEDNETTLADLKARIQKTIDFLSTVKVEAMKDGGKRLIPIPRSTGKALAGDDYLTQFSIPNFYFHLTMAYAMLRANGVDLGKMDYLGALDAQSMPAQ